MGKTICLHHSTIPHHLGIASCKWRIHRRQKGGYWSDWSGGPSMRGADSRGQFQRQPIQGILREWCCERKGGPTSGATLHTSSRARCQGNGEGNHLLCVGHQLQKMLTLLIVILQHRHKFVTSLRPIFTAVPSLPLLLLLLPTGLQPTEIVILPFSQAPFPIQ